jgi:hypothetical protein
MRSRAAELSLCHGSECRSGWHVPSAGCRTGKEGFCSCSFLRSQAAEGPASPAGPCLTDRSRFIGKDCLGRSLSLPWSVLRLPLPALSPLEAAPLLLLVFRLLVLLVLRRLPLPPLSPLEAAPLLLLVLRLLVLLVLTPASALRLAQAATTPPAAFLWWNLRR